MRLIFQFDISGYKIAQIETLLQSSWFYYGINLRKEIHTKKKYKIFLVIKIIRLKFGSYGINTFFYKNCEIHNLNLAQLILSSDLDIFQISCCYHWIDKYLQVYLEKIRDFFQFNDKLKWVHFWTLPCNALLYTEIYRTYHR